MDLTLTTPALLFPAISLLFLSYTNKFLALAALIRSLQREFREHPDDRMLACQLASLNLRVKYIKQMQWLGIVSCVLCVIDMGLLFAGWREAAYVVFALSLLMLLGSLVLCALEIHKSVDALQLQIADMQPAINRCEGCIWAEPDVAPITPKKAA